MVTLTAEPATDNVVTDLTEACAVLFPTGHSKEGIHIDGTRFHTSLELQGFVQRLLNDGRDGFLSKMQIVVGNRR
ncbi:hypothetical protein A3C37_03430 [Candidatus Peribacteria bacterium RIFCSPHIGHO2_02_FULL_53_20]|nr:MAG: hypothetical protein A3C37_03430 [Candidatus Peribacteria bacterium RIFCSPHIGHO2_02_FULL_53_20]OGJ67380.1 MAG: hypothetical protein A3B61_00400 [Candidatus Peribacteria bacterium RIFCSPLOWO2_01_FULL_53_10]OGJ72645.1 MAG: hypothetical protein A3G69_01865 [Candidatus Peribacteria bacterium RIFCSPLOWO2_12_FULL_53_10]